MKKKIICAILTLIMMLCIVCPAAYAETEDAQIYQTLLQQFYTEACAQDRSGLSGEAGEDPGISADIICL